MRDPESRLRAGQEKKRRRRPDGPLRPGLHALYALRLLPVTTVDENFLGQIKGTDSASRGLVDSFARWRSPAVLLVPVSDLAKSTRHFGRSPRSRISRVEVRSERQLPSFSFTAQCSFLSLSLTHTLLSSVSSSLPHSPTHPGQARLGLLRSSSLPVQPSPVAAAGDPSSARSPPPRRPAQ